MIIASIEAFPLRIPFRPGTGSTVSAWRSENLHAVDSLLAKVRTDEGSDGWGEAFGFTAVPVTQRAIDEVIARCASARTPGASFRSCATSRRSCTPSGAGDR